MERFTSRLLPYLVGCPGFVIEQEVLVTAITFCTDTYIWKEEEDVTVLSGSDTITLTPPTNSEVFAVKPVLNSRLLEDYSLSGSVITLDDPVIQDTVFTVTSYLRPLQAATALPDFLYNEQKAAIDAGTKVTLCLMPQVPWGNVGIAQVAQAEYLYRLGEAKRSLFKAHSHSPLQMQYRGFV